MIRFLMVLNLILLPALALAAADSVQETDLSSQAPVMPSRSGVQVGLNSPTTPQSDVKKFVDGLLDHRDSSANESKPSVTEGN